MFGGQKPYGAKWTEALDRIRKALSVTFVRRDGSTMTGLLDMDTTASIRVQGLEAPTSGTGLEIYYYNVKSYLSSYSRDATTYLPIQVQSSAFDLYNGSLTLSGDATVWKDINMGAANFTPIAGAEPVDDEFKDNTGTDTGIQTKSFFVGDKVSSALEFQHDYKEGSDFTFHVHWQGITAPTGTDKVKWQLIYGFGKDESTLAAPTTVTVETDFDTQYEFKQSAFAATTGTGRVIGDQFLFQLSRIAASADEYAGGALIATAGIHYEVDTIGSRTMTSK